MEEKDFYGIAWEILEGHEVKGIEQHKIEQLADKIVKVLARKQIPDLIKNEILKCLEPNITQQC